jgi:2-dehydro-3-deoxyphosphogluconate aldolase / (4S)-4-hydroxy-2-oxoglutarate aldolase
MVIEKEIQIIGILRGVKEQYIKPLAEASINAGLKNIEITMDTPDASKLITVIKRLAENKIEVGAGTVLTKEQLEKALYAGAGFIVMPTVIPEVIKLCSEQKIPCYPGALTPTEILDAWNLGATMVKVFPSSLFGPKYFKELQGPLKHVKMLACGGVTKDNASEYIKNGASGIAFGASIYKNEWMIQGNFKMIQEEIKMLVDACTF